MNDEHRRPLLYAHRGAAVEQPENTLPAFVRALEIGAHALETDLHMTRDGHIVVSHDDSGLRMTGVSARFRNVTLAQVKSWDAGYGFVEPDGHRPFVNKGYRIPTLEELLIELPDVPLNVDLKQHHPSIVEPVLDLIERTGTSERVIVASFHTRTLLAVRKRGYPGFTGMSASEVLSFLSLPHPAWRALWSALGGLPRAAQLPTHRGPVRLDTRERIDAFHRCGIRVDFWTIDDPAQAERLLRRGADGIMTNDPAAIKPVFDAFVAE